MYTDICAYIAQIWRIKSADGACTHSWNYHLDDHYYHHYHHQHCRRPARQLNIDKLSANVKIKLRHFQTIPFRDDKSWTCNLLPEWEGEKGILRIYVCMCMHVSKSRIESRVLSIIWTHTQTFLASNLWTKFRISLCSP